MKGIYVALVFISLIIIVMLALTFFYLDRQRHQTFLYALYYDGVLNGYEKVDRYILENSVIYKSVTELPRDILNRKTIRKIAFDAREKDFLDYKKEITGNGAKSLVYISNGPEEISFMAGGHGNFSYLDRVPSYGNDLPFENMCIAAYPPLIRRYNFKKRGEQFVNILTSVSTFLPPVRGIVSITSIGRDTIEIEGRKINCERLVLELGSGDLISVWVTRTFHNVLMLHMPKHGFKAIFRTEKKAISVEERRRKSDFYIEKDIVFANEDIALHGTLSVPTSGEAPYPAVILIWNSGPLDRNALGVFTDISHTLAEAGYCALRFDKRGIGQSQGFFSTYAQPEEISDLKCAIQFLKSYPEIDASRIALLGHSEGGFYAAYLAGLDGDIGACIIMSALSSLSPLINNCGKLNTLIKKIVPDDEEYLKSVIAATIQNREMIKDKSDWITILDKRVFTKKMALEDKYSPVDAMKRVEVPVLILHGRKDKINLIEEAEELGGVLAKAGNDDFAMIYFGELDHFFGTLIKAPPIRDHIEVDAEVLKSIVVWLDENLLPPPKPIAIEEPPAIEKSISAEETVPAEEDIETDKSEAVMEEKETDLPAVIAGPDKNSPQSDL